MNGKSYRSFEEFTREEIQPSNRIGFSIDEFDIETRYDEDLFFDMAADAKGDEEDDE